METLVKIGEINGAEKFIPIKSVHLVLHAYKSAFDALSLIHILFF